MPPAAGPKPSGPERIQKVLAAAGIASRRQVEQWMTEGRMQVNGRIVSPGDRISPGDTVTVDGRAIALLDARPAFLRVLAYYKPAGEICTRSDPEGRTSVFSRLPRPGRGRWINVGRLDYNTSGLLLFTTDGGLAHALMHPSREVEREYAVRVRGRASAEQLAQITGGVTLSDGPARAKQVSDGGGEGRNHWYRMVIAEGRNREIRRLWEAVGLTVSRLIRVRYGTCRLPPERKTGEFWDLDGAEIRDLCKLAGYAQPETPRAPRRGRGKG